MYVYDEQTCVQIPEEQSDVTMSNTTSYSSYINQ